MSPHSLAMRVTRIGLVTLAFLLTAELAAEELRTWSDATGKFSIEAKFVAEADGTVTLESENGKRFEIPLEKLSQADQQFVANLKAMPANPFQAVEENPFQAQADSKEPKQVEVNWAAAREINPAPVSRTWQPNLSGLAVDGEAVDYRPIPTPQRADFFEKFKGMAVSTASERVLLGYAWEDRKEKSLKQRYLLADLRLGKLLPFHVNDLTNAMAPLALGDDGVTALVRRNDFGHGKSDRLELWRLGGEGIERLMTWEPYGDATGGNRDISWGEFLPGDRAVTVSGGGKLAVWNTKTGQPLYHFAIKGGCIPGLSRDRKYLAYVRGDDVGILDLDVGEVLMACSIGNTTWPHLQLSPMGSKIACIDSQRLRVLDGVTGEVALDAPKREFPSGAFFFVDEQHLLIGNKILFNIPNQLKVWTYDGIGAAAPFGHRTCLFTGGSPGLLMIESLPQAAVPEAMAAAMNQPDFWALQPGTVVRIETDEITDPAQRQRIRGVLATKLEAAGFKVGDNGTIDLIASVAESEKPREVAYGRGFSPFGRSVAYEVKEFKSRLRFEQAGAVAWEQVGTNIPGMLHLNDGQSVKDALKEHEKPNFAWFDRVELPQVLPKASAKNTLGTTKVTTAGLR